MTPRIADVWVYLSTSPLLGLTLTLVAYQTAYWIYQRAGFNPLLNPVLLAIVMLEVGNQGPCSGTKTAQRCASEVRGSLTVLFC